MINLIPPAARRGVLREYWLRVGVVFLFLLGFAGVAVAALSTPAFVLIYTETKAVSGQYADVQEVQEELRQAETVIKQANELAGHLGEISTTTSFSVIISEINQLSGREIELSQYQFVRVGDEIGEISIGGVAVTRTALADFSAALEAHAWFEEANIPISNLAEDQDVPFTLTITPVKQSDL